jgi:hypothetical protein
MNKTHLITTEDVLCYFSSNADLSIFKGKILEDLKTEQGNISEIEREIGESSKKLESLELEDLAI